ncbi:DNRLRE domain-containing protein [Sulfurimonas sp. HSL3-7]|uniref:fibronectin type III domain-containing protein n=1 Tax=Sulfonitrofixus jiaomeiensis TaxID=3131938 RepID=UPI0031F8F7F9
MKLSKLFLPILVLGLFFTGCSGGGGGDSDTASTDLAQYVGEYEGTFSGDDSGTWSGTINSNGTFSGIINSNTIGTYTLSGTIDGTGEINAIVGEAGNGSYFRGTVDASGNISGEWFDPYQDNHGTFTGHKTGDTTAPEQVSNLTANAVTSTQIDINWSEASDNVGVTAYKIYRDGTYLKQVSSNYASDVGLSESTQYCYEVTALDAAGNESAKSSSVCATTNPAEQTVPSAPSSLTANTDGSPQIILNWTDNASNETGFRVERSTSEFSGFIKVADTAANVTSYTDGFGIEASATYYYRVVAINPAGESSYSNTANATTAALPTVPSAPTGLNAGTDSSSQITLNWTDNSSDETGFVVERSLSESSGFSTIATAPVGTTSYTDTSLNASTMYYYRVAAVNDVGISAYTNTASATTDASPTSITLELTSNVSGSITLTWTYTWGIFGSSNDGYQLEESVTSSSTGYTTIYDTTFTGDRESPKSYTLSRQAGTYYYRVRAMTQSGYTSYSNVVTVTVTQTQITKTYLVAADNLIMVQSNDASTANTSYPSAYNSVGCNWSHGLYFTDYLCGASLMYFDVGTDISGKTIHKATLTLYPVILAGDFSESYNYKVAAIYDNWFANVTWNTQPNYYASGTKTFPRPISTLPVEVDVTQIVQNWASNYFSNYGFYLMPENFLDPGYTSLRATDFYNKEEGADLPKLEITYE